MRARLLIIVSACASGVLAQTPIATVSSGRSFEVDGIRVPVAGLPSWPLMPGDTIATGEEPAVISFGGLGRLVLNRNSKLQLQSGQGQAAAGAATPASAVLLYGAVSVKSEGSSGLRVMALNQAFNPPAGSEMAVAISGRDVLTGPNTSSLEIKTPGLKLSSPMAAAKPKPTPTPTPTPPPPPSPK